MTPAATERMRSWSTRQHQSAWLKGYEADPKACCPYPDHRDRHGHVTGSRGFRNAWREGHEFADQERREVEMRP